MDRTATRPGHSATRNNLNAQRTALIVGAGIGGLAAGVSLVRAGWNIRICERAANPSELGFALALAPNAIAAIDELGLSSASIGAGLTAMRFELRHLDGRVIRRFGAPPAGVGIIALRSALHGQLLAAVGSGPLVLASEVVDFGEEVGGVLLKLKDGRVERGEFLVGADGVRSVIRKGLHSAEPPPTPSGFYALRGLARGVADHFGNLAAVGYFGEGIEAAAARASENAVYWYLSLLAKDLESSPREPWRIVQRLTATGVDPWFRAIVAVTDPSEMRLDELFVRPPLRHWGVGRVTLLGDAAHPVLPHTGQGAAQALEDAVALGLVLREAGDISAALREYERVRSIRTRRLIAMGPRIARMTTTRSPVRKMIRTALIRLVPESLVLRAARAKDPHRELRRPGA